MRGTYLKPAGMSCFGKPGELPLFLFRLHRNSIVLIRWWADNDVVAAWYIRGHEAGFFEEESSCADTHVCSRYGNICFIVRKTVCLPSTL